MSELWRCVDCNLIHEPYGESPEGFICKCYGSIEKVTNTSVNQLIKKSMEETKKREGGYYWCKAEGTWEILLWSAGFEKWFVPAHTETLDDSDFEEIDEKQIVRS